MKPIMSSLLVIGFLFASSAQAEVRNEVSIRKISMDGNTLSGVYGTGGGCASHKPGIEMSFDKTKSLLKVTVIDLSDKPDMCEAFISQKFNFDLKTLAADYLKAQGFGGNYVQIELQKVDLNLF